MCRHDDHSEMGMRSASSSERTAGNLIRSQKFEQTNDEIDSMSLENRFRIFGCQYVNHP